MVGRLPVVLAFGAFVRGVAAVGASCSGDDVVFEKHAGKDITYCSALTTEWADLGDTSTRCRELGDDCAGFVCQRGEQSSGSEQCAVRYHRDCASNGVPFFADSPSSNAYLKTCSNCQWQRRTGKFIPCYAIQDELVGTLKERKIKCLELGTDCAGITCDNTPADADGDETKCTVRDPKLCKGDGVTEDQLADGENEVSYVKQCTAGTGGSDTTKVDEGSVKEDCGWQTHAMQMLVCADFNTNLGREEVAKAKCLGMSNEACNGISCVAEGCFPAPRHCTAMVETPGQNPEYLKPPPAGNQQLAQVITFVRDCEVAADNAVDCSNNCYAVDEAKTQNRCSTACHCDGMRTCSPGGMCSGIAGLCLHGDKDTCKYIKHTATFMSCYVDSSPAGQGKKDDMKALCIKKQEACGGVTCDEKSGVCSLRHHQQCNDGRYLTASIGETTYVKHCGRSSKGIKGDDEGGKGHGAAGAMITIVLLLCAAVIVLLYKNRTSAQRYTGGVGYTPATQHAGGE